MVEPASRDRGKAVEGGDIVDSKEAVDEKPYHSSETMYREDIHGIVDTDGKLQLGRIIAYRRCDDAACDSGMGVYVSATRSGGDKACDSTRTQLLISTFDNRMSYSHNGPFLFQSVIHKYPCHSSSASSQIGDQKCHDSSKIGAQSRSGVESKPSKPQEGCTEHDVGDTMRSMRFDNSAGTTPNTGTQDDRICKRAHSASDLNGSTSGKIKDTPFVCPSSRIPNPTSLR